MLEAKRPERERLMITSATESWPMSGFALRFVINGAGEALMLAIDSVGAGMIADQIGERAARSRDRARQIRRAIGESGRHRMGGDGLENLGLGGRGGSGIFEVVETEILCGQTARGMLDIGHGRGRLGFRSDRRIGDGDGTATGQNHRGQGRGAERKSHLNV